jgi:hypothetical protein
MCGPIRPADLAGTDDGAWRSTGAGLDSSAALLRAESDHLDGTLRALIARMSSVPGLEVSVAFREGKLRRLLGDLPHIDDLSRRTGPIHRLVVAVGRRSYWLHADHGQITCGREITLGEHGHVTEEMSFSIWARTLFGEIAVQNLANYESMLALRRPG